MKKSIMVAVALFGALSAHSKAMAADVDLVLSSWLPPRHPIVVNAIKPWAKDVEQATEGRVSIRVLGKPLGSPPAHFDMAKDGVADITYGLHSFSQDDRFVGSEIGQFSFIGDDAASASEAFYNIYMNELDAEKEHAGTHILSLFVHGPGLLHTRSQKITSVSDFEGLKLRVPGGYVAGLTEDLGATPVFMSSPEVYEKLSRGIIDGVAFTYEALTAFRLLDDINYSMKLPGGVYNTSWFLVMNNDKWDQISDEDKAAINALSGAAFARRVGNAWNNADQAAIEKVNAAGVVLYDAPEDVQDKIADIASRREAEWAARLDPSLDGVKAIADMREMSRALAAGHNL